MNLSEREDYLEEKFLGKICCHRRAGSGIETIGRGKDKIVNVGSKAGVFKKVTKVEITVGPPSGWYWGARLWFEDGTFTDFSKMGDIEVSNE